VPNLKGGVVDGRLDKTKSPRFWEARFSRRRLGAWATSEGEPKPMRGSWKDYLVFPGAWYVKTLKPDRVGKGQEGSAEPIVALA